MTRRDDAEDYNLAAQVLERLRKGGERTFSAQEVRQNLVLGELSPLDVIEHFGKKV
jgi:predicted DNA-binding protein